MFAWYTELARPGEWENCSCVGGVVACVGMEGVEADGFELGFDEFDGLDEFGPPFSEAPPPIVPTGWGVRLRLISDGADSSARITDVGSAFEGFTSVSLVGTEKSL